ncbi:MAG: manganese transporter [Alphaproteobacteria bacterium HGW-Alphaproteobacteria-2]|nr:MAG: manganese transporter [Alphaproteobacteria bacterium HGW-Alphaproteobacteria-2]
MSRATGWTGAILVAAGLALAAPAARAEAPLRVLATTGMIADVTAELGGECLAAEALIGPGLDPHLYEATPSDIARLQQAELILHTGFGLEGQMGKLFERLAAQRAVLAVGPAAMPPEALIPVDDLEGVDPHLWMDPGLWARIAPVIAAEAARRRPDCAAVLPEASRVLVTAHDAFAYYGRAYGLKLEAVQGLSTKSEASIADIRAVADALVAARVPAVFVESTINPRTVAAVLEAAAAAGHTARVGGTLYSDAMGEPGTPEGSYIGMIRANTLAIVTALGGTPPAWPVALAPWAARWGLE